ncbi:MAG: hypothetical protein ABSG07_19235, partial [Terriglobales bacterium]
STSSAAAQEESRKKKPHCHPERNRGPQRARLWRDGVEKPRTSVSDAVPAARFGNPFPNLLT